MPRISRRIVVCAVGILAFVSAAFGQQNVGSIRGSVVASAKGIVVGADVLANNNQTGQEIKTQTNSAGAYNFPSLPVGEYTLTASFTGFKTVKHSDVRVISGVTLTVDIELPVGEITQTTDV